MRLQPGLRFSSIVLSLGLASASNIVFGESAYSHLGQVVDGRSGAPLQAEVSAWAQAIETNPGRTPCPMFGEKPLQSVTSSKDGTFKLSIPHSEPNFTDTYCVSDFVPRVDTKLENTAQALRIRPQPIGLYKRGFRGEDYQAAVVGNLNDLAYLKKVNPEEFQRVLDVIVKQSPMNKLLYEIPSILDMWTKATPPSTPQ
jgi:hypothetical protein